MIKIVDNVQAQFKLHLQQKPPLCALKPSIKKSKKKKFQLKDAKNLFKKKLKYENTYCWLC
jgi:hypothetical protein